MSSGRAPSSQKFDVQLPSTYSALMLLVFLLVIAVCATTVQGAYDIPFFNLIRSIFGSSKLDTLSQHVLLNIRLPRIALAIVAGAALGVTGAAMQALFRNPLAEPGLVGLSAGASLGAVLAIMLTSGGLFVMGSSAFLGALITTYLAYVLGIRSRSTSGLLLAGIAINTIVFSLMGLMIVQASDAQLRDITFWNMGSLSGATWPVLWVLSPLVLCGTGVLISRWRVLNALLLGDRSAFHLGYNLKTIRWQFLTLVALTAGPLVAVTGGIGFVGLVMPHVVRMVLGADHRWVMPASAVAGALALVLSDGVARVIMAPAELPIGLVTSLVGGPFFIWLLLKGKAR
jgi:iron complex transport system permease protein